MMPFCLVNRVAGPLLRCRICHPHFAFDGGIRAGTTSASASMKPTCPFDNFSRASLRLNQPALSISTNDAFRPDFGGHSISNSLLTSAAGSQSDSNAQIEIIFPLGCLSDPREINGWATENPVSSTNSRFAASRASSASSYSPFGSVQAPTSRFAQIGPPGCTRSTCICPSGDRRNINRPALFFGISASYSSLSWLGTPAQIHGANWRPDRDRADAAKYRTQLGLGSVRHSAPPALSYG